MRSKPTERKPSKNQIQTFLYKKETRKTKINSLSLLFFFLLQSGKSVKEKKIENMKDFFADPPSQKKELVHTIQSTSTCVQINLADEINLFGLDKDPLLGDGTLPESLSASMENPIPAKNSKRTKKRLISESIQVKLPPIESIECTFLKLETYCFSISLFSLLVVKNININKSKTRKLQTAEPYR